MPTSSSVGWITAWATCRCRAAPNLWPLPPSEPAPGGTRHANARYTGPTIMTKAPQTLAEALEVIRSMHNDLLAFRNPEFDLITPGREGEFDDRVKAVLAHSAPVFSMTTTDQTIQAKADAEITGG